MLWDVFVAYASPDRARAAALYQALRGAGLSVCFDQAVLRPGDNWHRELPMHLRSSAVVVLLVSSHTAGASFENEELLMALGLARRLIPLRLAPGVDLPYGTWALHALDLYEVEAMAGVVDAIADVVADPSGVAVSPSSSQWVPTDSVHYNRADRLTRLQTGFIDLDERLGGLQDGTLTIVGGRPGSGKSSFVLNIAAHATIELHRPTLYFSLEMSRSDLTQRLMASEARVDSTKLQNGRLADADWPKISDAVGRLGEAPLYIDDTPALTVTTIGAKARRLRSRVGDLALIIVDYVQLLQSDAGAHVQDRQVEVSQISRDIKVLARELELPVVALSQLSGNMERRADKRPMLSDLPESESLEADADTVLFIYRDEMYRPETADLGTAEIIVAKNRSGAAGGKPVRLAFLAHYSRFASMARL